MVVIVDDQFVPRSVSGHTKHILVTLAGNFWQQTMHHILTQTGSRTHCTVCVYIKKCIQREGCIRCVLHIF